jgi:hypothetical protein
MKKITNFFIALIILSSPAIGQTPMFFNTSVAAGANVFPFGNTTTSRKVQWFIPPGSLGAVTPGNNITKVWFQAGAVSSITYPIFTIKLKVGSGTGLTGVAAGPVEPGMTVVYTTVNQTLTTTTGNWFGFVLQTPWLYNPTLPLIVEVEHNATTSGPSIYQAVSIPGPGNGRQWADYAWPTITGVGTNQVNFGIDVLPATPCSVTPGPNTIIPTSFSTCPNLANPTLSLATTYSFGGITYQWQSSTVSAVGPFTAVNGATMTTMPTTSLNVTTWYQCLATCTNPGGGTNALPATQYIVGGPSSSVVPYVEDWEGLQVNDRLPNCSWIATNLGTQNQSNITSQSGNRIARSGTKFGTFNNVPPGSSTYYTNPIQMNTGITYSAGLWFATEYFGYNNWTNLSIFVGPNQSNTGLVQVATVGPAISGPYKALGGTFTVPSPGQYYVAIRATGLAGSAQYLSWDDLSVTIPCDLGSPNNPTVTMSTSSGTICEGQPLSLSAAGADTFSWSTGSSGANVTEFPTTSTMIVVYGTNTLTGCVATVSANVVVNPSPVVFAVPSKVQVCPGENSYISAYGASSYAWSNGANGNVITVSPNATTTYSVIGTNQYGCATTASVSIIVKPLPVLNLLASNNDMCAGELLTLTGNGAPNVIWYSSSSPILLQGNPINITLTTGTTFTAVGTGTNGCTSKSIVSINVSPCTGLSEHLKDGQMKVYPNPTNGMLNIELKGSAIQGVEITDISGRLMLITDSNTPTSQIDISNLANGVYYAKIKTQYGSETVRVIKE